jgi:hypothetical protein
MRSLLVLTAAVALALPATAEALPPVNDDFDAATVVSTLPFLDSRDATEATTAADDPSDCFGITPPSVWYRFTPTGNVDVEIETYGSDFDPLIAIYTGTRGNLTPALDGGGDWCSDLHRLFFSGFIAKSLSAGTTYYIEVLGPGTGGPLHFAVWDRSRPAPNDDIADAVAITSLPFKDSADNSAATSEPGELTCENVTSTGETVWYSFTPTTDQRVYATSQHSMMSETFIALYEGTPGSLTRLACGAFPAQLQWDAQSSTTYYIQIGTAGNLGLFDLLVQPAFRITSFSVKGTAGLRKGRVTVTGQVSCNYRTGAFMVSGTVTQKTSTGDFATDFIRCPASGVASWSASLVSATGRAFTGGSANVTASASGWLGGPTFSADEQTIARSLLVGPP